MAQTKPLSEDQIRALLDDEVRGAVGYNSSELSSQRQTALEYYYGEPFGNEVEGRSSYVSRDVADTIEWIMPSLMRIFTGGDTIVKFEPQGPEDEKNARQATDFVNYVFQRQNDGFLTLYTFCKDALLAKNGFVKVYAEEYQEQKVATYDGMTEDEIAYVVKDGAEIVEATQYPGPMGMLYAVKLKTNRKRKKCCVIPVPPEEVLVNKNPVSPLSRNRFVCHRRRVTISELKEMGFENVDDLADQDSEFNTEKTARFSFDETDSTGEDGKQKATRQVWLTEAYWRVDVDGDGVAELRQTTMAGNRVLEDEELDSLPLVTMTPIILPHKLFGMSVADLVMDLQLLKSTVFRQILDNMYLANNGRYMALDGMVNIDDLLTSRPGGIVRVKTFDAVKPMQPPLLGAPAFDLLEYIDTIKENRTGVTRYNQGLDADSLNKTATGINQIMSAAQSRIELIARVFAETGIKDLFYAILENVQKHYDKDQVIRLRNEWVTMDPQEWTNKFDLTVMVGLGTGSKEMQLAALNEETQAQMGFMEAGLPIVTPENVYNLRMKALEAKNIKGGDLFYTHPSKMPPPPPQQNPDAIKLALEQMKGEHKASLQNMKDEHKTQQMMMKQDFDAAKEKFKAAVDLQKQREQQEVEVQKQREQQAGDHQMQREQRATDIVGKREERAAQAHENDKARAADSQENAKDRATAAEDKLLDMLWEKGRAEEDKRIKDQQAALQTILKMIEDNNAAQNQKLQTILEAAMAERETEVTERDARGKAKKTTSRVKKKE